MRVKKILSGGACAVVAALTSFGVAPHFAAAAFIPGNLVVLQAGDGSAGLSSNATVAFVKEYTTAGVPVSSTPMPVAVSGANQPYTLSGSATSEGFLTLSADGQYLTAAGYGVVPGTVTPQTSTAAAAPRVVARIDMNQNIDTTTALTDAYNGSNIRSAVSTDGTNLWTGGNGGSGQGASAGVRFATLAATVSTQLNSTTTNVRVVNIYNGQLYMSTSSGTFLGVGTVGTGTPTTSGQTPTLLSGFPTTGTHSSYDFWFKDSDTLYVADDGSAANGGGIQKWAQSGGSWSLQYTLAAGTGLTGSAVGARGLAGYVDGGGNAVLFATTSDASPNRLVTITDTGAGSAFTTLATAPVGAGSTAFRGVEFLPVPEPASLGLIAVASVAMLRRRRTH